MRRIFLISLFGLCFEVVMSSGIVPQHAFAAPHIIYRQVVTTAPIKKGYERFDHEVPGKMMDHQPGKIYTQSAGRAEKQFQSSSGIPWPLSLPDFSFLWTQQHSNQQKDKYERGQ